MLFRIGDDIGHARLRPSRIHGGVAIATPCGTYVRYARWCWRRL